MKCPLCGSPAYVGLVKVECESPKCVHYVAPVAPVKSNVRTYDPSKIVFVLHGRQLAPLPKTDPFVDTLSGKALDGHVWSAYGMRRFPGETDDSIRDRVARMLAFSPVTSGRDAG